MNEQKRINVQKKEKKMQNNVICMQMKYVLKSVTAA